MTFLTSNSHARLKGYEGMSSLNASFAFRTYEHTSLMLYHPFSSSGYVAVNTLFLFLKIICAEKNFFGIETNNTFIKIYQKFFLDNVTRKIVKMLGLFAFFLLENKKDYTEKKMYNFEKRDTDSNPIQELNFLI